ncbi:MAG: isochorismatase family protein, partial [Leptospira sp.]|nr:isochorismatase family protein [Leptospira sp.]
MKSDPLPLSKSLLFTQCLQNDFVEPIQKFDPIPNLLHVGYNESLRLMGENPSEGALIAFMEWAMCRKPQDLQIIHIRDWHKTTDPLQTKHLEQFGEHCVQNTKGAEFVYNSISGGVGSEDFLANGAIVNASGLNDFHKTILNEILKKFTGYKDEVRVGIIGVWTEAKVNFLAYELATRFPDFNIAICSALTASSSRSMHYISLDQMQNILGIKIFSSIGSFSEFLTGKSLTLTPGIKNLDKKVKFKFLNPVNKTKEDDDLLFYLFRDCKSVEFFTLDGGFSGNLVLRAKSFDSFGHSQVPTVVKIGERDPISQERSSFERIEEVLGNNAPRIVDFAEIGTRGGIKYRYASMMDEKTKVFQDIYESGNDLKEIFYYLNIVFNNQLGRLYDAGEPEKLNLLNYYDFKSKYGTSVRNRMESILGKRIGFDESIPLETLFQPKNIPSKERNKEILLYNLALFYEKDLLEIQEISSQPHYVSYLHGDLNGRNIIIDSQKNVWLIDFFHTHRGHILKDLLKLENDILYIFTKIEEEDIPDAIKLTDLLLDHPDLGVPLDPIHVDKFQSNKIKRCFLTIAKLRSFYPNLIQLDRDPYQMHVGLLRYSVHTLSFDECSSLQKKWALYTSCRLAERIKTTLVESRKLRIDFLPMPNKGKIGMTILPGRKDRNRELKEDIRAIQEAKIHKIYSLITESEYEE